MQVKTKLRELRVAKGLDGKQMAQIFNVHFQVWYRWERGEAHPKREYWPLLEAAFGVKITELFPDPRLGHD